MLEKVIVPSIIEMKKAIKTKVNTYELQMLNLTNKTSFKRFLMTIASLKFFKKELKEVAVGHPDIQKILKLEMGPNLIHKMEKLFLEYVLERLTDDLKEDLSVLVSRLKAFFQKVYPSMRDAVSDKWAAKVTLMALMNLKSLVDSHFKSLNTKLTIE